jgi:ParB family transcriptional regulator, chromosome partitioning protein
MDEQTRSATEGTLNFEGQGQGQGFVRRRLGRGLSALLGSAPGEGGPGTSSVHESTAAHATSHSGAAVSDPSHVHVELIERNPFQPRKDFETESLEELVESIRQHGVLQPLLVRPCGGGQYQLIAGERRLMAAKKAGLETVPCRVLELEDRAMCEAALEENLKRRDLNVLEKAQAFKEYMERFDASIDDVAKHLSMSRSSVCNFLRLLDLTDHVKDALLAERVSFGHARAILSLAHDDQIALCQRIEKESLSVRETEAAVRDILKDQQEPHAETIPFSSAGAEAKPVAATSSAHVRSLEENLQQIFAVAVQIKVGGKEKGKIVIPFANNDEFERILRHLRRAA